MANVAPLSTLGWDRRPMGCGVGSWVSLGTRERTLPAIKSSLDLLTICALHKAQRAAGHGGLVAVVTAACADALSVSAWAQFVERRPDRISPAHRLRLSLPSRACRCPSICPPSEGGKMPAPDLSAAIAIVRAPDPACYTDATILAACDTVLHSTCGGVDRDAAGLL